MDDKNTNVNPSDEETVIADAEVADTADETKKPKKSDAKKLRARIEELQAEVDEKTDALELADDKYLRLMAEYDNFRRRSREEKSSVYADAVSDTIMELLRRYVLEAIDTMERDKVRLNFMGDMTVLAPDLQDLIAKSNAISARLEGCQCNICLNYGGRAEIVQAARRFAEDCAAGKTTPDALTEQVFDGYLYSAGVPSPELMIRPGGEQRLSNFLLWQCAYSEFYYTDVLWPDFTKEELHKAIAAFQRRDRRFGGIKK